MGIESRAHTALKLFRSNSDVILFLSFADEKFNKNSHVLSKDFIYISSHLFHNYVSSTDNHFFLFFLFVGNCKS